MTEISLVGKAFTDAQPPIFRVLTRRQRTNAPTSNQSTPPAGHDQSLITELGVLRLEATPCSAQITTIGEEALRLLARMVEKGLVHAPGLVPEFWHQQVFDMSKPPSRELEGGASGLGGSAGSSKAEGASSAGAQAAALLPPALCAELMPYTARLLCQHLAACAQAAQVHRHILQAGDSGDPGHQGARYVHGDSAISEWFAEGDLAGVAAKAAPGSGQELMLRQQLLDWVGTCLEFPRGLAGAEAAQTLPSTTLQSPGRPHHSAGTGAADGIPRLVQNALLAIALGVAPGGRADASGDSEPAALSWWIETEEACLAEGVLDIIQRPYRALYPEPQTDTVRFPPLCKPLLDNPTVYNYPESFGTKISTSPTEITS
eukprot:gene29286-36450_t